jgi:hypothetical protein
VGALPGVVLQPAGAANSLVTLRTAVRKQDREVFLAEVLDDGGRRCRCRWGISGIGRRAASSGWRVKVLLNPCTKYRPMSCRDSASGVIPVGTRASIPVFMSVFWARVRSAIPTLIVAPVSPLYVASPMRTLLTTSTNCLPAVRAISIRCRVPGFRCAPAPQDVGADPKYQLR